MITNIKGFQSHFLKDGSHYYRILISHRMTGIYESNCSVLYTDHEISHKDRPSGVNLNQLCYK